MKLFAVTFIIKCNWFYWLTVVAKIVIQIISKCISNLITAIQSPFLYPNYIMPPHIFCYSPGEYKTVVQNQGLCLWLQPHSLKPHPDLRSKAKTFWKQDTQLLLPLEIQNATPWFQRVSSFNSSLNESSSFSSFWDCLAIHFFVMIVQWLKVCVSAYSFPAINPCQSWGFTQTLPNQGTHL